MIRHVLRSLLFSEELITLVSAYGVSWLLPGFFSKLNALLFEQAQTGLSLSLYVGLFAVSLVPSWTAARRILFPKESNRKLLNWPKYPQLKASVYLGVAWQVLSVAAFVTVSLYADDIADSFRYTVPLYAGTLACMASLVQASVNIRAIVERHS